MEDDMESREFNVEEQLLEMKYLRKLRAVQVGYVSRAMLILSTVAAASDALFEGFAPCAMVMDEASQFLEARAVFFILEAMSKGRLRRILLIGDDKQL
jgi:superfamily I DNA and/or RNA helicase